MNSCDLASYKSLIVILLIIEIVFFSVYQHGKDFDAIQNLLTQKLKKRSDNYASVKTKEQIRHFYYRTWHKISGYVKSSTVEGRNVFSNTDFLVWFVLNLCF